MAMSKRTRGTKTTLELMRGSYSLPGWFDTVDKTWTRGQVSTNCGYLGWRTIGITSLIECERVDFIETRVCRIFA